MVVGDGSDPWSLGRDVNGGGGRSLGFGSLYGSPYVDTRVRYFLGPRIRGQSVCDRLGDFEDEPWVGESSRFGSVDRCKSSAT